MKHWRLILAGAISLTSAPLRAETKVEFIKDIQPILKKSCIECHGPDKQKGKLRLDTKETALTARDPQTIVAGDAEKSELYRRITLPAGHDDIMPNKGEPLSKADIDLIRDWINQGAHWPDAAVIKTESAETAQDAKAKEFTPAAAEEKAIADLQRAGIHPRAIAMNVPWREVSFHLSGSNITDQTIQPIKDILSLVHVNLAGTIITDAGLAAISGLTNLTRLHLEKTAITDAGLSHLKSLVDLNYLNLYGTQISDAGLEHLKNLPNLQRLYLWQTKVTDSGVAELQKALPKLEISRGWDLKIAANEPEKVEKNAEDKQSN